MFDPASVGQKKADAAVVRRACERLKGWAREFVPDDLRSLVRVTAREVQCGDPECAPIDTIVEYWFDDSPENEPHCFGLPMTASEVCHEDIKDQVPDEETLRAWSRGEDPEWPKPDPPPQGEHRFQVGQNVEVRVPGVEGSSFQYVNGVVTALWSRLRSWPTWAYMPYTVKIESTGCTAFVSSDTAKYVRAVSSPGASALKSSGTDSEAGGTATQLGPQEGAEHGENDDDEEEYEEEEQELSWRFDVGDRVQCHVRVEDQATWCAGTVDMRDVPEPNAAAEGTFEILPYEVLLDPPHDRLVSVTRDYDGSVRALSSTPTSSHRVSSSVDVPDYEPPAAAPLKEK